MPPLSASTRFSAAPRLPRRNALKLMATGAASLALPALAAWPDKPIRIIVTFPAGGASDIVARVMAEQLSKKVGQAVVVDNRPGAGGSVGGLLVAQAPADGHTLMLSNSTPISIGPFALEKQPYDPVQGFTHIALIGSAPCVVMANPAAPIKTMPDLEAQARKLGRLDFGSGGPASIGHIYGELMKKAMGVNLVHIPYRGGAPMTTDLIAGVIPSLAGEGMGIAIASGIRAGRSYIEGGAAAAPRFQRDFAAATARPIRLAGLVRDVAERPRLGAALLPLVGHVPGLIDIIARATRIGHSRLDHDARQQEN